MVFVFGSRRAEDDEDVAHRGRTDGHDSTEDRQDSGSARSGTNGRGRNLGGARTGPTSGRSAVGRNTGGLQREGSQGASGRYARGADGTTSGGQTIDDSLSSATGQYDRLSTSDVIRVDGGSRYTRAKTGATSGRYADDTTLNHLTEARPGVTSDRHTDDSRLHHLPERPRSSGGQEEERDTISVHELICLRPEEVFCAQDEDGDNEVMLAIIKKNSFYATVLIDILVRRRSTKYLNMWNNSGYTALHLAVIVGLIDVTLKLIAAKVDCEIRDLKGNTPLHWACSLGRLDHVIALTGNHMQQRETLQSKMQNTARMNNGVVQEQQNGVRFAQTKKVKHDPTAFRKSAELLNYRGWNGLHLAAQNSHYQVMEYLVLVLRMDVNAPGGNRGMGIIHMAVQSQDISLLLLIVRRLKADVNLKTYDGWSPIQFTAFRNDAVTAKVLVTHGAHENDYHNCLTRTPEGAEAHDDIEE